ncbi:MAG TPA: ATP-binding protein, partial [Ferruginibacter sp.]|nr:ATP-binding protein [Ferruginibacter sp.]
HFTKYLENNEPRSMNRDRDLFALKKDGSEFPVEICLNHYHKNDELFIVAFINNITERKNATDKIHQLREELERKVKERTATLANTILQLENQIKETAVVEEELKRIQQLFLQLLKNYPDGAISIIDRQNNFIYTGGTLHTQFNLDPSALIGNKIYPEFPEPVQIIIQSLLDDIFKNKIVVSNYELPIQPSGEIYVIDAFPLLEEDGTIDKVGVIIRNISELKKTEDELRKALEKEKELNELKSRFVSMASHEFRTPLSTILSSAYLIDKYTAANDQAKREKHVRSIVSAVIMLTDILNDFLSVGKIEEGKIQVRFNHFNIQEVIKVMIKEIKPNLKKGQKIKYSHTGNQLVLLDQSALKHIMMNLLTNASKFSPENTNIEIKTTAQPNLIIFSIKDRGIGISKEDQKHLMERFFRGANAGNIQGTGLGLHIVSKYAQMMNGHVSCISELEKGTEFVIHFDTKNKFYEKDITDRRQ